MYKKDNAIFPFVLFGLGIAVTWAYWPALTGPFLFDDFSNLNALEAFNQGFSPDAWRNFFLHGTAGPSGRPLSLLTFLIDDWAWPSTPWAFKYTNLMLHLINSALLMLVMCRLAIARGAVAHWWWVMPLLAATLWSLNPYHVSSVMYVVQRMALLSTACVLAGLWLYLLGRARLAAGSAARGYSLMLAAYGIGAGVGVLFKENAALFVLLVPLLEWLSPRREMTRRPLMLKLGLTIPAVVFVAAVALQWPSFQDQYHWFRDFSLGERLMTQARALGYYLWRYLVPGVSYVGVFGDGFPKSTGLLAPPSTLIWVVVHASLVAGAIILRHRWPLFSLGILFFYVAHLMESGVVPLELFFEHRNYLPSAFLFAPLLVLAPGRRALFILGVVGAALLLLLRLQASFWADEHDLKVILAVENPRSERAITTLAAYVQKRQGDKVALEVLDQYAEPAGIELAGNRMTLRCRLGIDRPADVEALLKSPRVYRAKGPTLTALVEKLAALVAEQRCQTLSFNDLRQFLENYLSAWPRDGQGRQAYFVGHAQVAEAQGSYEEFRQNLHLALEEWPNRELVLNACPRLRPQHACECLREFAYVFENNRNTDRSALRTFLGYGDILKESFEDAYQGCEQ